MEASVKKFYRLIGLAGRLLTYSTLSKR